MSVAAKCLLESKFALSSNNTEYSTPALTRAIIDKFTALNADSVARVINVYIVPSGGTVGTTYQILKNYSIAAGATFDSSEMKNQILNTGDFVVVAADAPSVVSIRMSGREVT